MSLAEAREVLKAGPKPGLDNYLRHGIAAVVYGAHQMRTRPKEKRLHFDVVAPPGYSVSSTSTAPGGAGYSQRGVTDPFTRGAPEGSVFYPSKEHGAQKGEGPVGGELLMEIDAPVSAILVIAHGNGKTGIYRVGTATNAMNAGRTLTKSDTFIADSRARVRNEQARNEAWAAGIKDFWQKQQARA
jgi:hypothetical protein